MCGRAWSPDEQIVVDAAKSLKMRIVPNLEVCCVCVLNATNLNYTEAMDLLVADAKAHGFAGYVMDMICGGHEGKNAAGLDQRAIFIDRFKANFKASGQDQAEVSWFSHGFYHPEVSFPNNGDFLYDMDTCKSLLLLTSWLATRSQRQRLLPSLNIASFGCCRLAQLWAKLGGRVQLQGRNWAGMARV
eukprot:COSAG02_NODE_3591_length_6516_cov_4.904161_5_plen_188_part_00